MTLTRDAVAAAVAEFRRMGRDDFLAKYGFGYAKRYFLVVDGKRFDSKAIYGVAHGYLANGRVLTHDQFSGGRATVMKGLEALGFEVVVE